MGCFKESAGADMVLRCFGRRSLQWKRTELITSENPFGGLRAFQNGFARTRSDADASTHKKGARRHADASDEANADR